MRLAPLDEARVVAGDAGLDNEVSWPAVLRVRPPAFEPLNGRELALVSLDVLRLLDASLSLAELIARLSERKVAAVVVVGEADRAAMETAERGQLPLLVLPETSHFSDLGPALSRVMAEEKTRLYQLGLDVHHQLAEVSMTGRGPRGIVSRLAELSGRDVALQDSTGGLVVRASPADGIRSGEGSAADLATADRLQRPFVGRAGSRAEPPTARIGLSRGISLVSPVLVRDAVVGFLSLLGTVDDFVDEDQVMLSRGSVVCALEMAKQEAVIEAEQRLRGDFFDDLLESAAESAESLANRGRHLGYDVQQPHAALAVRPEAPEGQDAGAIDRLTREIGEYLSRHQIAGMVAPRRPAVALFLAIDPAADLGPARRLGEELQVYLTSQLETPVGIGLGSHHPGALGLRTAYREAEQAERIGREIFGSGQVTSFADLGVYRLLYTFRQSPDLADFCRETLAPLADYDAKNGMSLVETLDVYLRCDANLGSAAEALYLHRNSLAYRLRRISELTGFNLDHLEDRFRLQLALKARRLVQGQEPVVERRRA
ncbi:MAG: helix-turn-helix domain-containing protein [Chloroflexota bacterium]